MGRVFTPKELCDFLEDQHFSSAPQYSTSHIKFVHPNPQKVPKGIRPFIIVISGRKQYDPHTSASYRTQLRRLGISDTAIKEKLG